jgi:hypothetical protein
LALVRSAGRWLISGQLGVIETDRVADKRFDSSKFTGNFAGCGEARHLPVHGADLGVCKHVNSATSCVGGVADHRRPGAGSVPAGPGRSFHLEATGSEPLCLADVPLVSSTVFPTGQVDCFDESAPRSGTFCRSGPHSPS